jgi:hypothetical protein
MNLVAPRPIRLARLVWVVASCGVALGCGAVADGVTSAGGQSDRTPAAARDVVPTEDGLYCRTVSGAAPVWIAGDRLDLERYWSARRQHEHVAAITAPGEIAQEWTTIATFTRDVATPMIESGDLAAPPTEPSEVAGDRARVAAFDREVCGTRRGAP